MQLDGQGPASRPLVLGWGRMVGSCPVLVLPAPGRRRIYLRRWGRHASDFHLASHRRATHPRQLLETLDHIAQFLPSVFGRGPCRYQVFEKFRHKNNFAVARRPLRHTSRPLQRHWIPRALAGTNREPTGNQSGTNRDWEPARLRRGRLPVGCRFFPGSSRVVPVRARRTPIKRHEEAGGL